MAGEEALTDWRIVLAPPLVLVNQLPMPATFLVWELPKVRTGDKPTCFPITLVTPEAITINNPKPLCRENLLSKRPSDTELCCNAPLSRDLTPYDAKAFKKPMQQDSRQSGMAPTRCLDRD